MEVVLNERDMQLYKKLFISEQDIGYARACALHIKKSGWHHEPWSKRGAIYFNQSVFVTAMIVSYARVFNRSKGLVGFPTRLARFNDSEKALHERIIAMRDEVCAHSDGSSYSIRPWHLGGSVYTDIVGAPILKLTAEEVDIFLAMTARILSAIEIRVAELRSMRTTNHSG